MTDKGWLGLSSTQEWLEQIASSDLKVARRLLRALHFVGKSAFELQMRALITSYASSKGPAALFAVRDVDVNEDYFPPSDGGRWSTNEPSRTVPGGEVGSEGAVALLIRNIARADPARFLDHPSPQLMRQRRCSSVVLVDDFVSTGVRMTKMLDALRRYKWLRSWHSYRWVRVHAVAFCVSVVGERKLRTNFRALLDSMSFESRPQRGIAKWSLQRRREVEAFCEKYGKLARVPRKLRLGYCEGLGTVVLPTGCSSITPPILWKQSKTWRPLLKWRQVPEDIDRELARPTPQSAASGNEKLDEEEVRGDARDSLVYQTLEAAARKLYTVEKVSSWTGIDRSKCIHNLGVCRSLALIDDRGRLTDAGRAELRRRRRQDSTIARARDKMRDFYYPKRVRGVRSVV
jgi:hypothetical protein